MQIQCTHKNKSDNHMIEIPVYIVLPDKIGEFHTEPFRTKQNTSRRMEVTSPQKIPSVYIRGPPYTAIRMSLKKAEQNVPKGTRTECSRRNQNRMFLKEPELGC